MTKIGIITAMKEEAEHIIKKYQLKETKKYRHITVYENGNIILVLAGIWKIQASLWTAELILMNKVDIIINIGIAGNLRGNEVSIGDVFLINQVSQHDMILPFTWEHLDYIKKAITLTSELNLDERDFSFWLHKTWHSTTGDVFISDQKKAKELRDVWWADVAEMEAFAVASVARELWMLENTYIIKAISDGADTEALRDSEDNLNFAMKNSLQVLEKIIEKYS